MMSVLRRRLAALCDQITQHADMDQAIRAAGAGAQLDALLAAIQATDTSDPDVLTKLLDEIEDACARDGLAGVTTALKQYTPLPGGFHDGQQEPATWVCPLWQCTRVVFDDEVPAIPLCAAGGNIPMAEKRVL